MSRLQNKWTITVLLVFCFIFIGVFFLNKIEPEFAYLPSKNDVLNPRSKSEVEYYDLWGKTISLAEARKQRSLISPSNGVIHVTPDVLRLGKKTFYQETFGNEVFLTDILGLVDGPITVSNIVKSIVQLRGKGTTNLQVPLAKTVTIAGKTFRKGTKINTGIDIPKGSYLPIGMPFKFSEGRMKVGVSCAACHATVDTHTMKIVEGAYNSDLNSGLLFAMATNSSAFFTHAEFSPKQIQALTNHLRKLPDKKEMENLVDLNFMSWPKGMFDTTIDMKSNPTKIPDAFTAHSYPYGWSGFASVGPFKGLSTFSNNVHAQNSDSLSQSVISQPLFGMNKDMYLGIILQNAANQKYRYQPKSGMTPSQFFTKVDPTPNNVGVNENISPRSFPKVTPVAPDGLIVSSEGYKAGEQINAVAAWQNTIIPAKSPVALHSEKVNIGKQVFQRANCIACHAGNSLTKNQVIPVELIKTEPSRAGAFQKTQKIFGKPVLYPPNTPVPIPKGAKSLVVPIPNMEQIRLGFAHNQSKGGYKIPSLKGLYWRAPYLHDSGVSIGPNPEKDLGVPGTLLKHVQPNPIQSLRALIDRNLRQKVINANQNSSQLKDLHIQGIGHSYWVDQAAGFSKKEQDALIEYLLSN